MNPRGTTVMDGCRESDSFIVPRKPSNKAHIGFQGRGLCGWCPLRTSPVPTPDRRPTVQGKITHVLDAGPWAQTVRAWRWPASLASPAWEATPGITRGCEATDPARQRAACPAGHPRVAARTDRLGAGPPHPLLGGRCCRACRGWPGSHAPRAHARDVALRAAPPMPTQRREGSIKQAARPLG